MIDRKLSHSDDFWNVKAQEKAELKKLEDRIELLRGDIGLANHAASLAAQPGYQELVKHVGSMEAMQNRRLLEEEDTNEMIRLQGEVRALYRVRVVFANAEEQKARLEKELEDLENERKAMVLPDGKIKTGAL